MKKTDIDRICDLHIECFKGDFLPSLGKGFLKAIYEEVEFIYINSNGFIVGTQDSGKLFKRVIKKHFFRLLPQLIKRVILDSSLLKKVFETLLYSGTTKASTKVELLSIAVDKRHRKKGVGRRLVKLFEKDFKKKGFTDYKVTVKDKNLVANNFYKNLGFLYSYSFKLYNEKWNLYTKEIK